MHHVQVVCTEIEVAWDLRDFRALQGSVEALKQLKPSRLRTQYLALRSRLESLRLEILPETSSFKCCTGLGGLKVDDC
jgi:hypothetical protein